MVIKPHWLPKAIGVHAICVHTELILCTPARAPGGDSEDRALWAHEREHAEQQAEHYGGAVLWWLHYLASPWFRAECEILAYRVQIAATYPEWQEAKRQECASLIAGWLPYLLPLGWARARRFATALRLLS